MKISSPFGLLIDFLNNGCVQTIEAVPLRISLRPASPFSGNAANVWIRKRGATPAFRQLTGPGSSSRFIAGHRTYFSEGEWEGIEYCCRIRFSEKSLSWAWEIDLQNNTGEEIELDLVHVQDVGLKEIPEGLTNEYYVSQYIERRILEDRKFGKVICCRQNMNEDGGNPWLMIASANGAVSASVDGMQFYGSSFRETGIPEGLTDEERGGEYAGESSVVAIREKPFIIPAGGRHISLFAATFLHNHPPAISEADLDRLPGLIAEFPGWPEAGLIGEFSCRPEAGPESWFMVPTDNLFNTPAFFPSEDLSEKELSEFFGNERRHVEVSGGRLLSFFCRESNHVMLRSKESLADRPHGHIMQADAGPGPSEAAMSTTAFAFGAFNSHITQGNTNFNTLLSVCNSQFNLSPETGQRIFAAIDGKYRLLGVPSAFEMGLNFCRWIYKYRGHYLQVRTWTSKRSPQVNMDFRVLSGENVPLLVTHHFDDLNGWKVVNSEQSGEFFALPSPDTMITSKFPDASFTLTVQASGAEFTVCGDERINSERRSEGSNMFVLDVAATDSFILSITGGVTSPATPVRFTDADKQWGNDCRDALKDWSSLSLNLSIGGSQHDIELIREILPWYGMNALTHYLTPYGLEQFSGAAWGTRDIAQGPIELLLSLQKYAEAREILRIILSNQEKDGGWPQWWMFDSYSEIRADSAHGDIIYWILIALSNYLRATSDFAFLGEKIPYFQTDKKSQSKIYSLGEHINRLVKKVTGSFVPGTTLVKYGGGDWNDSLQPVSRELADRMISSWTVEMNYQAFRDFGIACRMGGLEALADEMAEYCGRIRSDFNKFLLKDGVVAGYGLVEKDGSIGLLLHPSDVRTGIKYSLLPMERGILSGIFTPEQAARHQELIEIYLKGPDGARLMDRPLKYSGGIQILFRRAETSTFFGREIGLMYVHEHIRYAESLAITGRADDFLRALRQTVPAGYSDIVPNSDVRQSNCYYSSSDVIFPNRYAAYNLYPEIVKGNMMLRGGWRVYSSGPGIFIGIIISRLLGFRVEWEQIIIDPVMPACLDGLTVTFNFMDRHLSVVYHVRENCFGPSGIKINGSQISYTFEPNPYRRGGAVISAETFKLMTDKPDNRLEIWL